jgi:hypothetical protein
MIKQAPNSAEAMPGDCGDDTEPLPCVKTWKNMSADHKKKPIEFYRETGIFTGVCRHGAILLVCDMVRSGEL